VVSNTLIIGLSQSLIKAGIQNLKRKRHGKDGKDKSSNGGDNSGTGNQIECMSSPVFHSSHYFRKALILALVLKLAIRSNPFNLL
jgi:hypothetical protein